jgi:autotransporter-associated beta strand protein
VARSGGDVTVSASSVLVPGAGPITLSNVEQFEFDLGAARLIKSGGGAVVLAGANSYSGGTTVSAGTLQLTSPNALPVGGTLTIGAGATVVLASGLSAGAESMAAAIAVAGPALAAIAPATGSTSASQATVSKPQSMPQATAIAKTVAASALVPPYRVGARERVFGSAGLRGRDDLAWLRPLAELRAQNQLPRKNAVALFAVDHVLAAPLVEVLNR